MRGLMYLVVLLLVACGGGGGGSSASTPTPAITGALTLSASSVIQGGSITVTVPVSGSGYVAACLSPSLASSPSITMCNGGAVSGNSINIPITVAANATPTSTYWVAIMTCASQVECAAGNGIAYNSYNGSATYYSVTDTQGVFVPPYLNTTYTIPQFTVTSTVNPNLPGMTAAPNLSASSVAQGGAINVTVPVTPATGFVGACLSTSLMTGSTTTMCGGGAPISNSTTFTINIDPAAAPANTYYVWVLTCANATDCGNNTGTLYASNNSSATYYSATETHGTVGTYSDTGYFIPQFSITSSGGGGGGGGSVTGVIPGGITAVPVISPSSVNPGGIVNVTVPVTNDTGWIKVCTKSTQAEWSALTTNYGCGDAAAISNSASVNVTLSNSAPATSTYWVTLLACSTQADCTAGTGLGYSLTNLGGYSTVYYSATVTAGTPTTTPVATAYTIPYFSVTAVPVCGNGLVEQGEQCDDWNTASGDGCSSVCQVESGWLCTGGGGPSVCNTTCGDGVVAGTEQCDDGANNGTTFCGCQATCTYTSASMACSAASCSSSTYTAAGYCNGLGACMTGPSTNCSSNNQCMAGSCTLAGCSLTPVANGTACNSNGGTTCQAGSCI